MRFAANRSALAAAVHDASPDLSAREDILAGRALLRVAGNELTVVGRDSFTMVIATLQVIGHDDGETCVDHRRLDEFLRRAAADEVRATLTSSKLKLRAGVAALDLPTHSADAITLPPVAGSAASSLPTDVFTRAIERVLAASHEDTGKPLWGVNVRCTEGSIVAEASDGKRFARAIERSSDSAFAAMLNRRFVLKLIATTKAAAVLKVAHGLNQVVVDVGDVRIFGSASQIPFPGLGDTMDGGPVWSCKFELARLLEAVEMMRVVDEEAPLRLEFLADRLRLSARSPDGEVTFSLRCDGVGTAGLRSVSLRDFRAACQSLDAATAVLSVADSPHPVVRLDAADDASSVRWVLASRSE